MSFSFSSLIRCSCKAPGLASAGVRLVVRHSLDELGWVVGRHTVLFAYLGDCLPPIRPLLRHLSPVPDELSQ